MSSYYDAIDASSPGYRSADALAGGGRRLALDKRELFGGECAALKAIHGQIRRSARRAR